jgi:salicylate hydroxylase
MPYGIASGKTFNMVLSHVDKSDLSTWTKGAAIEDMRGEFSGWDPQYVILTYCNRNNF